MKKIGVIADPHSNAVALQAVMDDMPDVDRIICAGDLVGYGPQPNEVVEMVKSMDALTVLGNHDHAVITGDYNAYDELAAKADRWNQKELKDENMQFLKKLDKIKEIEIEGHKIFVAHGTPRKPLKEYLYPGTSKRALAKMTQTANADVIILGHTHVPMDEMIQGKLVINPGSSGQPRDREPEASYMVLNLGSEREVTLQRVSYDIDKVEKMIEEAGLPEKFATRLHFGW